MRFVIRGYPENDDYACFKKEIPVSVSDLEAIMGWAEDYDYMYDYRLTGEQVAAIERLCSISLPSQLELFLTCRS